jgi:hypothetical protein
MDSSLHSALFLSLEKRLGRLEQHLATHKSERNKQNMATLQHVPNDETAYSIAYDLISRIQTRNPPEQHKIDAAKLYLEHDKIKPLLSNQRLLAHLYTHCIKIIQARPQHKRQIISDERFYALLAQIFESLGYPKFST